MKLTHVVSPELAREASGDRPVTDVAVGILIREQDNAFLLTSRPHGKPYEGYWEFPGGKLEPRESVLQALHRELEEEIGVSVESASLWQEAIFDYPQAIVRLHFCKVFQWRGDVQMREGQNHIWSQLPVRVAPVLPGTFPVLDWLANERNLVGCTVVGSDM
ncbi:MAG: 8-oxo-dGTP diphosphatase MutT [Burkholderiales bacterium PBB4]|nr:MAG: 8-oxo-dGTP diphosphatase MutT [Burkholderiales bacterium PBB4]